MIFKNTRLGYFEIPHSRASDYPETESSNLTLRHNYVQGLFQNKLCIELRPHITSARKLPSPRGDGGTVIIAITIAVEGTRVNLGCHKRQSYRRFLGPKPLLLNSAL